MVYSQVRAAHEVGVGVLAGADLATVLLVEPLAGPQVLALVHAHAWRGRGGGHKYDIDSPLYLVLLILHP